MVVEQLVTVVLRKTLLKTFVRVGFKKTNPKMVKKSCDQALDSLALPPPDHHALPVGRSQTLQLESADAARLSSCWSGCVPKQLLKSNLEFDEKSGAPSPTGRAGGPWHALRFIITVI